ncbi:MAG: TadE/TadG family type IV pilus assembly protein [Sphingopyxis sp.]
MSKLIPFAAKPLAKIRNRARALKHDTQAIALIETAVTLPVLLFLSFAGLEIANLMITHTRISAVALSVADNASRIAAGSVLAQPQVREIDVNDVFQGARIQAGELNFQANGRVILSSLEVNATGGQWIHWQRCYGNLAVTSAFGPEGTGITGTSFPGMGDTGQEIKAAVGNAIMFAEVSYRYTPIIMNSLFATPDQIDYEAAFAVRDARDTTLIYNPNPAAVPSICPTTGTPRKKRGERVGQANGWSNGNGWGNSKW